jgi:hypothetical protein
MMARREYPTQPTETGTPFRLVEYHQDSYHRKKHHNCVKFGVLDRFQEAGTGSIIFNLELISLSFASKMPQFD